MDEEMQNCKLPHLKPQYWEDNITDKLPQSVSVKWIVWTGLKTFVWLPLLETVYDKQSLICPKMLLQAC